MSEQVNVPDDLKKDYETACMDSSAFWPSRYVKPWIERIAALEAEIGGFPNLAAMRQCMIDTADENAALRQQVERLSAELNRGMSDSMAAARKGQP